MIRNPEEIYDDIVKETERIHRRLTIALAEIDDNGKILEKTVEFKIPMSDEFAKDFSEFLQVSGDKKYKIRFDKE